MIALVTGGSGCGKSTWAEKLTDTLPRENRIYIATMQVYDEESRQRVRRHRAQRADKGFVTVECGKDLDSAPVPDGAVVLLEDLVNLAANEMFDGGEVSRIPDALWRLSRRCRHLVMVTNDVFSDGAAYAPSVQEYLRCLARINRKAAEMADSTVEVVYSIPVAVKGRLPQILGETEAGKQTGREAGRRGFPDTDGGKTDMKLYIGGAYQGQEELAREENPGSEIWPGFQETVRRAVLEEGKDPREFARGFILEHPGAVIVANEVGSGVVPGEAEDRAFREAAGRALCVIAQAAEQVTRCICGIGTRIK